MVERVEIFHSLHTHSEIVGSHGFDAAVFVSGSEHELLHVVEYSHIPIHHHRGRKSHFGIGALVLGDAQLQVAIHVVHAVVAGINLYRELLVAVVVVDIGARRYLNGHLHLIFTHHESGLQHHIIGVFLAIHAHQIVARNERLHLLIGEGELIVHELRQSSARELIVFDVGIIESIDKLRIDQPRRAPVGIAVHESVAQIGAVVLQLIEGDSDVVVVAAGDNRRKHIVAIEPHEQRVERGVEGASAGILYVACISSDIHYHNGYKQENILHHQFRCKIGEIVKLPTSRLVPCRAAPGRHWREKSACCRKIRGMPRAATGEAK